MKLRLTDNKGKSHDYHIVPFSDRTMEDYDLFFGAISEDLESEDPRKKFAAMVAMLSRLTGAPKAKIGRITLKDIEPTFNEVSSQIKDFSELQEKAPPKSLVIDGEMFIVPQDLGTDTYYAQWYDFTEIFLHQLPEEGDALCYSLAVFCLKDGEDYDSTKVSERAAKFRKSRMVDVLSVCAFFFETCEQYRSAMQGYSRGRVTSLLRSLEQEVRSTEESTVPS